MKIRSEYIEGTVAYWDSDLGCGVVEGTDKVLYNAEWPVITDNRYSMIDLFLEKNSGHRVHPVKGHRVYFKTSSLREHRRDVIELNFKRKCGPVFSID